MRRRGIGPLVFIVVVALAALVATIATDSSPELGLDLQGGASVVLRPPDGTDSDTLDTAIEVIRSRVDALGVAEPEIVRQGDTVLVELPGVDDQARALEIVGQTAELQFRPVLNILPPVGTEVTTTTTSSTTSTTATTVAPAEGEATTTTVAGETTTTTTTAPTTTTTLPEGVDEPEEGDAEREVLFPGKPGDDGEDPPRYVLGPTEVLGRAIDTARASFPQGVEWIVELEMTSEGIEVFNELAGQCNGLQPTCPTGQLAIVLDGVVQSAPSVDAPSFQRDEISISGSFDEGSAKDLALVLKYGSLPVQLEQQDAQTVSASLGKDSLRAGLIAGLFGTGLVLLYMVLYYRLLGLVVLAGLAIWAALMWATVSWLSATQGLALSLSGATGIIVSIGVTVDTYVVFFERLKDEVRAGHTIRTSVDRGFKKAWRTVLAANVAAFIGAALLYWLTVGPVRGFAFFLALSTILDMVVAWFFTRPTSALLARRRSMSSSAFVGVRERTA